MVGVCLSQFQPKPPVLHLSLILAGSCPALALLAPVLLHLGTSGALALSGRPLGCSDCLAASSASHLLLLCVCVCVCARVCQLLSFTSPHPNLHFPGGSVGKESACNAGDRGSILGSGKIPWRRAWQPIPVFLPGPSHGQRSLVGYSPWGRKESDMTE